MTENERRNLFTYATKELSQDAFLMWLFNNYDDGEVAPAAYALLREFCGLAEDEKITELNTKAQEHKIDISVYFETDKGKKYALFIEDKTDSAEHDQLKKYNESIDPLAEKGYKVCKVYYKPGYLYPDEIERVKASGWGKPYRAGEIYELLKQYETSENLIVRQYIVHIRSRRDALSLTERPTRSKSQEDILQWFAFFDGAVIPKLKESFGQEKGVFTVWKGRYPYAMLQVYHNGREHVPYLEIRSRDCTGGEFRALLLCFHVEDEPKKQELIKRAAGQGFFSQKGMRKEDPKQIGWRVETGVETSEEFLAAVKRSVQAYFDLMKDWD